MTVGSLSPMSMPNGCRFWQCSPEPVEGLRPAALALGREPAFRPMPLRIQAAYPERDLGFVFQPQRTRRSQRYWFGSFEISSRWLCALRVPVVKFFLLSSDFPPPSRKKSLQSNSGFILQERGDKGGEEKRRDSDSSSQNFTKKFHSPILPPLLRFPSSLLLKKARNPLPALFCRREEVKE